MFFVGLGAAVFTAIDCFPEFVPFAIYCSAAAGTGLLTAVIAMRSRGDDGRTGRNELLTGGRLHPGGRSSGLHVLIICDHLLLRWVAFKSPICGDLQRGRGDAKRRSQNAPPQVRCGAPETIRTSDTRFRKPVLYPLSYEGGNAAHACEKHCSVWGSQAKRRAPAGTRRPVIARHRRRAEQPVTRPAPSGSRSRTARPSGRGRKRRSGRGGPLDTGPSPAR